MPLPFLTSSHQISNFYIKTDGIYLGFHILWVIMKSEKFPHSKKPCFCIFLFAHLIIKSRKLGFLEFLWKVLLPTPPVMMLALMVMMYPCSKARIKSMCTIPPLRCIQEYTTFHSIIPIHHVPFLRPTSMCTITLYSCWHLILRYCLKFYNNVNIK